MKAFIKKDNFFSIFKLNVCYDIDLRSLEDKYIKICKVIHPDNFIDKSQKKIAEIKLVEFHRAYETIKNDLMRAEHIMDIMNINYVNFVPDHDFLSEIFDLQISVQNGEHDKYFIKQRELNIKKSLNKAFNAKEFDAIRKNYLYLKYFQKIG